MIDDIVSSRTVAQELQRNFPTWMDRITIDSLDKPEENAFFVEAFLDGNENKRISFTVSVSNTETWDEGDYYDD